MNMFHRMWCKLFGCEQFVNLKTDVTKMKADVATLVIAVTAIANQFPIVIPPPVVDLGTMPLHLETLTLPDLSVWFQSPDDADQGEEFEVEFWAKGTMGGELAAFGLSSGFLFVPEHFNYVGIERGAETIAWNSIDANEVSPGVLTVGGFAGGARGIVGDKPAHLFTIKLTVATAETVQSEIMADNYVDDIVDMLPQPISFIMDLNGS